MIGDTANAFKGAVMVFFMMFALVAVGVVSYSCVAEPEKSEKAWQGLQALADPHVARQVLPAAWGSMRQSFENQKWYPSRRHKAEADTLIERIRESHGDEAADIVAGYIGFWKTRHPHAEEEAVRKGKEVVEHITNYGVAAGEAFARGIIRSAVDGGQ